MMEIKPACVDRKNEYANRPEGRWRLLWIGMAVLVATQVFVEVARAGPTTAPTVAVPPAGCVTADCHANIKDFKVLHGPVNVNACDACHTLVDEKKHVYTLARPKADTCTFCHKLETHDDPVVHKPLMTGDCLPCHNPHGGPTEKFLRGKSTSDLCKQCHKDVVGTKKMVHGPVAAGACEACHQPHTAKYPKLLLAQGKELCLGCHKEMAGQMKTAKTMHKPVAEGECSQCHDPHASDNAKQIRQPPLQLCTSCHEHEKIKQDAMGAKYKHTIVTSDQACLNCHTAHGGSLAKLMKDQPIKVCMSCHSKQITVAADHVVPALTEVTDPKQIKHGPIQEGNCSGCHNVHGSELPRLLTKPYPAAFYQPFSVDKYELCFSCHDKQLVLTETTRGLTNFRDGERNLHYLHVSKSDRGRSCRACHETHASHQPLHIRDAVPYGNWKLPINFERSSNGGTCSPGCHKPYTYDRERPAAGATVAQKDGQS